jgi:hypothetical protein
MSDIYRDIECITGEPCVMPHILPDAIKALLPYLRTKAPESRFWIGGHDPSHVGEIDIPPMNSRERSEFWARFGGQDDAVDDRKTTELDAAEKLMAAEKSMLEAASALDELGSISASLHAKEMRGAVKVARKWELELRRIHAGAG